MEYCVLMSVYIKENPSHFDAAIKSMLNQSLKPSQIFIICDGPLTNELNAILNKYLDNPIFKIKRLEKNVGLGQVLNIGINECEYEYILRMDSDDISLSDRAEKEIALLDSGFDLVGSYISEFVDDPNVIKGYRKVPLTHDEIVKFAHKRSPFNHPSVAFKKSVILEAGNYSPETRYMQDYYLWIRCIQKGCNCCNISESLVNMRSGVQMRSRRSGKEFRKSYRIIFRYMRKTKFISFGRYLLNRTKFFFYSIINPKLKEKIVYKFLRSKKDN